MSWSLHISGLVSDCYSELDTTISRAKEKRTVLECEHIDAAIALFRKIVPNDIRLRVNFNAVGAGPHKADITFNSTCYVSTK